MWPLGRTSVKFKIWRFSCNWLNIPWMHGSQRVETDGTHVAWGMGRKTASNGPHGPLPGHRVHVTAAPQRAVWRGNWSAICGCRERQVLYWSDGGLFQCTRPCFIARGEPEKKKSSKYVSLRIKVKISNEKHDVYDFRCEYKNRHFPVRKHRGHLQVLVTICAILNRSSKSKSLWSTNMDSVHTWVSMCNYDRSDIDICLMSFQSNLFALAYSKFIKAESHIYASGN